MGDPEISKRLPPEPPQQREIVQAVLTIVVAAVVIVLPDTIPVIAVVLALLGLYQNS